MASLALYFIAFQSALQIVPEAAFLPPLPLFSTIQSRTGLFLALTEQVLIHSITHILQFSLLKHSNTRQEKPHQAF